MHEKQAQILMTEKHFYKQTFSEILILTWNVWNGDYINIPDTENPLHSALPKC